MRIPRNPLPALTSSTIFGVAVGFAGVVAYFVHVLWPAKPFSETLVYGMLTAGGSAVAFPQKAAPPDPSGKPFTQTF